MVLTMAPTVAFAADTTSDPAAQSSPVALGHYDAGFTLSTYTHATEGMKRSAADTIGSVISQTM